MKKGHKIRNTILILIIVPVSLLIAAVFTLVHYPQVIINPYFLEKGAAYAKNFGVDVEWKGLDVDVKSHGLLEKTVKISFEDLSVKMEPDIEKAFFSDLVVGIRYKFFTFIPSLVEVGPVKIDGGDVIYHLPSAETPEETGVKKGKIPDKLEIPDIVLPDMFKKIHFNPIDISIKSIRITDPDGEITGNLTLTVKPDEKKRLRDIVMDAAIDKTPEGITVKTKIEVDSESGFLSPDAKIDGDIALSGKDIGNGTVQLSLKQSADHKIDYDADVTFNRDTIQALIKLSGALTETSVTTGFNIVARDPSLFVDSVALTGCRLSFNQMDRRKNDGKLELNCPVTVTMKKVDLPKEIDPVYEPPDVLKLVISSDIETFFMPDMAHETKGRIDVKLLPVQSKLVKSGGFVAVNLDGTMEEIPKSMNISANMDIDLIIGDFKKLVGIFKKTPFAVPAPLNALEGEVELSLEGKIPSLYDISHFPVAFKTRLTGPGEKVYIDVSAEARLRLQGENFSDTEVDVDVMLTKILLPLPTLHIAGLPRFMPDSRVVYTPEEKLEKEKAKGKEKEPPLHYEFSLATPENDPVEISTGLTKKAIPIHLNIKGKDEKVAGTVGLKEFVVKFFQRQATIKHLTINLKDPSEDSTVSGEIVTDIADYEVKVLMEGLMTNPSIWFESEPPLSEDDVVSLMLYGETFDELDADLATSVGNMRSAKANKAIAFTTFFLLASTPIQAIIYDPETKQFSARFKLGKKTSLVVGTRGVGEEKSRGIGIRRRLGKGWQINTSIDKYEDDATTPVSAFIEWHKRY